MPSFFIFSVPPQHFAAPDCIISRRTGREAFGMDPARSREEVASLYRRHVAMVYQICL